MRALASLSLDLDNKWAYLRTHGDPGWQRFPSYLDRVVPRLLDFLAQRELRITVFVVGQDATHEVNRGAFAALAASGHEIASHSFSHEPWLQRYSDSELDAELAGAEAAIEAATGARVDGFRGPGYSLSAAALQALARRGYRYDSTAFPNLLSPLARWYFFASSSLTRAEKMRRRALFGNLSDAVRPVKPYRWDLGDATLIELPVTTIPVLKIPMHFSYVLYLAQRSRALASAYFRTALAMCRLSGTEPSLLLHPLDFLDREDEPALAFFPAMGMRADAKMAVVSECLEMLVRERTVVTVGEHVDALEGRGGLPRRLPRFAHGV